MEGVCCLLDERGQALLTRVPRLLPVLEPFNVRCKTGSQAIYVSFHGSGLIGESKAIFVPWMVQFGGH
jgi:hypothetical protein